MYKIHDILLNYLRMNVLEFGKNNYKFHLENKQE